MFAFRGSLMFNDTRQKAASKEYELRSKNPTEPDDSAKENERPPKKIYI